MKRMARDVRIIVSVSFTYRLIPDFIIKTVGRRNMIA
jgi:hypothetical protein